MTRDDKVRIHHMLDSAREAVDFTHGLDRKDIDSDRKLNLSLVRLLEIIGEAARGVSDDFRETNKDIPWEKMAGMRDRLIHGYFDVNLDIVWETVKDDLPSLIEKLENIRLE